MKTQDTLTPDTSGLRTFKVTVRGSDPRWQRIEPKRYVNCSKMARTGDFPVDPTDREVTVAIFPVDYFDHEPSNKEVIVEIDRRHLTPPDWAVTEITLDVLKDERDNKPTVGVCGARDSLVVCVSGLAYGGRNLLYLSLDFNWNRYRRFIAVVSDELI